MITPESRQFMAPHREGEVEYGWGGLELPLRNDVERELWARVYASEFDRISKTIKTCGDYPAGAPHDVEGMRTGGTKRADEAVQRLRERSGKS